MFTREIFSYVSCSLHYETRLVSVVTNCSVCALQRETNGKKKIHPTLSAVFVATCNKLTIVYRETDFTTATDHSVFLKPSLCLAGLRDFCWKDHPLPVTQRQTRSTETWHLTWTPILSLTRESSYRDLFLYFAKYYTGLPAFFYVFLASINRLFCFCEAMFSIVRVV